MHTPNANRSSHVNITVIERYFRALFGAAALAAVLAGATLNPALIFSLSLLGIYLMQTVLLARDPVYALTGHLRLGDHLQVWLQTLATGALLPLVMVGDLISSLAVFLLSSAGGLFATAAITGKDTAAAIMGLLRRPLQSNPLSA